MKVWGITEQEIKDTVDTISEGFFDGNVEIKDGIKQDGRALRFTLKCPNSRGAGAKESDSGRRTTAASWHVHKEVMVGLFSRNKDARIQTALADYKGFLDFAKRHEQTYYGDDESWNKAYGRVML